MLINFIKSLAMHSTQPAKRRSAHERNHFKSGVFWNSMLHDRICNVTASFFHGLFDILDCWKAGWKQHSSTNEYILTYLNGSPLITESVTHSHFFVSTSHCIGTHSQPSSQSDSRISRLLGNLRKKQKQKNMNRCRWQFVHITAQNSAHIHSDRTWNVCIG